MQIVKQSAQLLWATDRPLEVIESAARTCYKSEDMTRPGSAERLVARLIDSHHDSMLEQASASFRIITDRGVAQELTRHRVASFAMQSTRYCNFGKEKFGGISVVQPPQLTDVAIGLWMDSCLIAERSYLEMLKAGAKPELARAVLPLCLSAELVMTANFREWRHVVQMRAASAAQPQIRELIVEHVWPELHRICPLVFPRSLLHGE